VSVPFVDMVASCRSIGPEALEAMRRVVERGTFVLGPEVTALEAEFAAYCETAHGVGVDSGTSALELALRAFDIGPGDEVVTAANTFIATVFAIRYTGARPVLADVDARRDTLDPAALERAITPRTRAVIPVHLYGQPADMDPILAVARRHRLVVIEDACQAHGARYRGRRAGGLGDAAAFSFYPSKNLVAFGDGGMVVTGDAAVAERLRGLRDYGQLRKYHHRYLGYNRRLDELQAAVLRVKLRHLDAWNAERRRVVSAYHAALAAVPGLVLPRERAGARSAWHLYTVRTPERDALQAHLKERGIATAVHYPRPIHLQPALAAAGGRAGDLPVSERLSREVLSLPLYPELDQDAVTRIAHEVAAFCGAATARA
jgi:dTDP-4-amino-4,6-dideoxygalactose transaminase